MNNLKVIILFYFIQATVLVSYAQNNDFPYKLNKADFAIVTLGTSAKLYANYLEQNQALMSTEELLTLDKSNINAFDRYATNNWNKNLSYVSDITRGILVVAPSVLLANQVINKQCKNGFTIGAMYFEVALVTWGLTDFSKTITLRKRPYLYNTNLPLNERIDKISSDDVYDSFFSGHASITFASAVFLSKTYTDIYGKSTWSKVIWGSSMALAAATGYLRVASGQHYSTDVIAGALVGSAVGYFIPVLHKTKAKNEKQSFIVTPNTIYWAYRF
ncbi:MAG: phosphatase PAP2 family protein [Salinivirgaceae bacterium]|jgi:membrane-associated phospholipid phosphatase|nr:phosphatase PAP2 family protein [Salinivirgaceae bacterium]